MRRLRLHWIVTPSTLLANGTRAIKTPARHRFQRRKDRTIAPEWIHIWSSNGPKGDA